MEYPIYIKYPDGNKYLFLKDETSWEEISLFGKKKSIQSLEVKIFSDRVYLQDTLKYLEEGLLIQITKEEYQKISVG